jgi:hypothetical protein
MFIYTYRVSTVYLAEKVNEENEVLLEFLDNLALWVEMVLKGIPGNQEHLDNRDPQAMMVSQ